VTGSLPPKACNDQNAVGFVKAHAAYAAQVAGQLQVPTENLLGLSAAESGYGTGPFAINGRNNFFSLHGDASAPFANGSAKSARDGLMSTFPSYKASAQSFAAQYGNLVRGKSNPTQFVGALVPRFNSTKVATGGDPQFVPKTVSVIQMVKARMGCK